jgi:hypothetical protein
VVGVPKFNGLETTHVVLVDEDTSQILLYPDVLHPAINTYLPVEGIDAPIECVTVKLEDVEVIFEIAPYVNPEDV